jgi:SpoIID/LytB domain protein
MGCPGGRVAGIVACVSLVAAGVLWGQVAAARDATDAPLLIAGTGSAHGLGMAMDGVQGEARAGWTADRILSLFYTGSVPGHAGGIIRVGLASGGTQGFDLPGGGTVSDGAPGQTASEGFPIAAMPGARVVVTRPADGIGVRVSHRHEQTEAHANGADPQPSPGIGELTPPPDPLATPTPAPKHTPVPTPTPDTAAGPATSRSSIWIVPQGDTAVVGVDATGHRYRGMVEVRREPSGVLQVINHLPLDTYVAGIAEEKGAGWPDEGLKTLAIAARSLGAAAMTWHDNNHAAGYDICPTENCQVYLGLDGEEPAMQRAATATAGQIRTFRGRPILAMYHGNGGGITESYKRLSSAGTDPYPYLKSVRYPYASPSHWERAMTYREVANALGSAGENVPIPLVRIEVAERGDSPRVLALHLVSNKDEVREISGPAFARALHLRSTWFDIVAEGPRVERAVAQLRAHGQRPLAIAGVGEPVPVIPTGRSPSMLFAALLLLTIALAIVGVTSHRRAIAGLFSASRRRPRRGRSRLRRTT